MTKNLQSLRGGKPTRRQVLNQLALSGVVCGALGTATQPAGAAHRGDSRIHQTRTVRYDSDATAFVTELTYQIPSQVTELVVMVDILESDLVTLRSRQSLDRPEQTRFVWSGGDMPSLTVSVETGGETFADGGTGGYVGEKEAVGRQVIPHHSWRTVGGETDITQEVTFDGDGFAGTVYAFAGPHSLERQTVNGIPHTLLVAGEVSQEVDTEAIFDGFTIGGEILQPRLDVAAMAGFVFPEDRQGESPKGFAASHDTILFGAAAGVQQIGNVPTHEYCHALYGVFGDGEMYWLKEASAEYFGSLIALHAGYGTFESFLKTVRTGRYADAVLADIQFDDETVADYEKGAHVLAALDGEIRSRSGGEQTLADVMTGRVAGTQYDLSSYEEFVAAVTAAADDESLADWIDRHIRTDALPEVPTALERYALEPYSAADIRRAAPTRSSTPPASTSGDDESTGSDVQSTEDEGAENERDENESTENESTEDESSISELASGFVILGGVAGSVLMTSAIGTVLLGRAVDNSRLPVPVTDTVTDRSLRGPVYALFICIIAIIIATVVVSVL